MSGEIRRSRTGATAAERRRLISLRIVRGSLPHSHPEEMKSRIALYMKNRVAWASSPLRSNSQNAFPWHHHW